MVSTVPEIGEAVARLRSAQARTLAGMSQSEIVALVAELAVRWAEPTYPFRREAEELTEPFPFAMTGVSLDALIASLSPNELWRLIDSEGVRGVCGPPLVGHVIAGNTPLLAWVSILRALLMRSASLVKLPSSPAGRWGRLFLRSLAVLSPAVAECITLFQWQGGTRGLDAALCGSVDLVLAYGGDDTLASLRALCPLTTPFVGYGHRVSFGLVSVGANVEEAAWGFAQDVLLYDQGGCLSPHTIYVEGESTDAEAFGAQLAAALAKTVSLFPLEARSPQAAMQVSEARLLARMEADTQIWEGSDLRWTVIARPYSTFALSPTYGVVSVQPIKSPETLSEALAPVKGHLQGCAVAEGRRRGGFSGAELGLSYVCRPGELQAPPFSWREDGRDVLRSLLPGGGQDDQSGL